MALPDTTFNDLSQDEQKLAWAVYNKVTESSLDFDEQTLASSVDRVLMVNAAGTAAGTASLADLTTGLDGKYQSNLANVGSYIGVDITKKRNIWDEEWENGTWTSSTGGSGTNLTPIRCVNFIPVKPSASYYITCSSTSATIYRRYYDANFTYLGESTTQETTGNRSFVIPSNARYMKFYVDPSYGSSYKNDIAIIEGTSGVYVPYVPQMTSLNNVAEYIGVPLDKPRNWWNEQWENGYIETDGSLVGHSNYIRSSTFSAIKPSTTYTKVLPPTVTANAFRIHEYDASYNHLGVATGGYNVNFTTRANARYFKITGSSNAYGGTYHNDIAIVEGSVATPYVPYVPTLREGTIVASGGSDATGYYVRFSNGVQMCWKTLDIGEVSVINQWGTMYISVDYVALSYPMAFISVPTTSVIGTSSYSNLILNASNPTNTKWQSIQFARGNTSNLPNAKIQYFAIGRWK